VIGGVAKKSNRRTGGFIGALIGAAIGTGIAAQTEGETI
jgi:hypothetical protein